MSTSKLIILVADADQKEIVEAVITRLPITEQLTKSFEVMDIIKHPQRDGGVFNDAHTLLQGYVNVPHIKALIFLDFEFARPPHIIDVESLKSDMMRRLSPAGWTANNCAIIVPDPEIENWVWVSRTKMQAILRTNIDLPNSVEYYITNQTANTNQPITFNEASKPNRPKEALRLLCQYTQKRPNSALFRQFWTEASYRDCQDTAFLAFKQQVIDWFA